MIFMKRETIALIVAQTLGTFSKTWLEHHRNPRIIFWIDEEHKLLVVPSNSTPTFNSCMPSRKVTTPSPKSWFPHS